MLTVISVGNTIPKAKRITAVVLTNEIMPFEETFPPTTPPTKRPMSISKKYIAPRVPQ